ncbi:hypothetical protein BH11VER1_BH11VER1_00190 [soil metagenome]
MGCCDWASQFVKGADTENRMNRESAAKNLPWYAWLFLGPFFLVGLGLLASMLNRTSSIGGTTKMIMNGKQLVMCVLLYSSDHDGKFPHTLQELVDTEVLSRPELDKLLTHPYAKPQKFMDWIYLPDLSDKTAPYFPVLISPVLQDNAGKFRRTVRELQGQRPSLFPAMPVRVVAFSNGSVEVIKESDLPALLKKYGITLPAPETTSTVEK